MTRLVLFDLDHTLLSADSDALWCEFLIDEGVLHRQEFEPRNRRMAEDYRAGMVDTQAFCDFYVGTLAGRTPAGWQSLRERFLRERVTPKLPTAAHELVDLHRRRGEQLVLTTATNRYITELTAALLGIEVLIATEAELVDGVFSGRTAGMPNMREGKVARLHDWLASRGMAPEQWPAVLAQASFYSDSANDLPLLHSVGRAVAVDPDPRLLAEARQHGWPVLHLRR